ncbi:MAG: hypothetical protein AAGH70_04435 [Pseudomonadota bacterium]
MSDPVENYEIEDVLSSIRRLVSQEGARSTPDPAPEGRDAFVLTPDARVDAGDVASEDAASSGSGLRREAATAVRSELERAIEELEAAMGIDEADAPVTRSTGIEDIDWEAPVGRALDGFPPVAEEEAEDPGSDQGPDDLAAAEEAAEVEVTITPSDADIETPEDLSVLDLAEAPDSPAEAASDPTSDAGVDSEEDAADPWIDVPPRDGSPMRSAAERLHLVSSQGDSTEAASGAYDEFYEESGVSPSISPQLEATLADQADDFDAPQPPFDRMKDDPFTAASDPADFDGQSAEDVTEFEAILDGGAETEVSLDEEQLRDMVAEIVREELQGELGERITRNVRRLVRREINRALAGQDLI